MCSFFCFLTDYILYKSSLVPPLRLVFMMWLLFSLEYYSGMDFGFMGVLPRSLKGLLGIFTAPLIHGNLTHLASNTFPILFLGTTIYYFYNRIASRVFIQCYFLTNFLVWIFGREFYHIGASGLVYALASFLISFGIFRRETRAIFISVVIVISYGGLIYGISPANSMISWESHLLGAIVGVGTAFGMSKIKQI
ncbi:MAG: membrane associated rhomboid family serine protease [Cyclobacteriaceae bacterium]|jgi:membrane associated rhomboid family serine protease